MQEDQRATAHFGPLSRQGSSSPVSRQGFLCRNTGTRTFVSRQGLELGLGGLGRNRGFLYRDRGFLCRNRVLLVLCRDRGRCRDRMWSRLGGLVS